MMERARLRIKLFGKLHISMASGASVQLPSSAAASSLLAYLVLHHDTPTLRDRLAGCFWPDQSEARARRALSNVLWQLRSSLDQIAERLIAEGEDIVFCLSPGDWLDVAEFERLLVISSDMPPARRLSNLQAAVALYRGDLLADLYDDWCLLDRERLRERYLWALAQILKLQKRRGDYDEALAVAHALVTADPLRESAWREVMRLCHLLGRPREALAQFERLCDVLQQELGAEPMASSVALYREIAAGMGEIAAPYLPIEVPPPLLGDLGHLPFVGRREERARLLHALKAALQGHGGLAIVCGAAGVGKSRLVREILADAEWRGFQVGLAKLSPLGAIPPYQLLREALSSLFTPLRISQLAELVEPRWLSALAPLFPAFREQLPDLPKLPPLDLSAEWQRLWEALARCLCALASIAPLLLVLEDVHWADNASLAALPHLAAHLADVPFLLLITSRIVEAQERPLVLETLESAGQNTPLTRITLAPFAAPEIRALLQRALETVGHDAAFGTFARRLGRATGGNALHLLESLKFLLEQGLLIPEVGSRWRLPSEDVPLDAPTSVKELVTERAARISASTREVLERLAVLGEAADFRVLSAACQAESALPSGASGSADSSALEDPAHRAHHGLGDEQFSGVALSQHLERLRRRGFLRQMESGYRFEHDQIQRIVYSAIAPERRRRLHRCAGRALEAVAPDRVDALAYHFDRGEQWDKAAEYSWRAGDSARAIYANDEAAAHYDRAMAALDRCEELPVGAPDSAPYGDLRFALHLAREEIYALRGEREAQAAELTRLVMLASSQGDDRCCGEVLLRQARYMEATCNYEGVIKAAQEAIAIAAAQQWDALEAESRWLWGLGARRQGEYDVAQAQLEAALELARAAQLKTLEAHILRSLGVLLAYRGQYERSQAHLQDALRIYREAGDLQGEAETTNNLGSVADYREDFASAKIWYERSLEVCREIGYRRGEGDALNNLGILADAAGDYEVARSCYEQCHRIYREIHYRQGEGWVLGNLGYLFDVCGDYERAGAHYRDALAVFREISDRQGESSTMVDWALYLHHRGDNEMARRHSEEALATARELGDRHVEGHALNNLAHALAELGELEAALRAYEEAATLRHAVGESTQAMESRAGVARVSLALGDTPRATAQVETILAHLEAHGFNGAYEPLRLHLTCYRVLRAAEDARAQDVLAKAHELLQARAARIVDPALRRSFLENVAAHREIGAAWRQRRGQRVTVRLPRAGAPTGRALRDEEIVAVAWTVSAPEDDAIAGKLARRRCRILRLLREASAQGAEATVDDLAEALDVSARTIKRDLAALRAEGHGLATRGSRG